MCEKKVAVGGGSESSDDDDYQPLLSSLKKGTQVCSIRC